MDGPLGVHMAAASMKSPKIYKHNHTTHTHTHILHRASKAVRNDNDDAWMGWAVADKCGALGEYTKLGFVPTEGAAQVCVYICIHIYEMDINVMLICDFAL
jgi:hypothetical protein